MNQTNKFKYGTVLKVLTIISGVIMALASLAVLLLGEMVLGILEESSGQTLEGFMGVFYVVGILMIAIGIVMFIASTKVAHSKGWNIFIIIFAGLTVLGSLTDFQIVSILFYGAMLLFAILNVVEANKRGPIVAYATPESGLEAKLKNLNDLHDKGLMSTEEYQTARQNAIEKGE